MIDLITDNQKAIAEICSAYGVESLEVFGSAVTSAFDHRSSDVDFIVRFADMSPGIANRYLDFAEALERLLGRPVDVMFDQPITNPFLRRSVATSRTNVFERSTRQEADRSRAGDMLGGCTLSPTVNFASMGNSQDFHDPRRVIYRENDPVVTDTDSPHTGSSC